MINRVELYKLVFTPLKFLIKHTLLILGTNLETMT